MFKIVSIVLIITLSLAEPTVTFSLKQFILNEFSPDGMNSFHPTSFH